MKRDMQKDLELCERATPGLWERGNLESWHGDNGEPFRNVWVNSEAIIAKCLTENCDDNAQFIAESREALPYYIKRCMELEELLKEIIPAAKFQSCFFSKNMDADPTFHCCDWSEWIEKVQKSLEGMK